MRILTFTSLFPDSTRPTFGVFVYQRMVHVARRPGNTVTVVAPVPYVPSWVPGKKARAYRSVPHQEQFQGLTVYHPRYPFLPKISAPVHGFLIFLGAYFLVRRLVRAGVDCIDAHFVYPDGFAAVLLGRALHVPVVVSARGTDINLYPTMACIRPQLRWTLRHAGKLIGVSKALSEAMIELGAPPGRVRTIGNGVDPTRFFPVDPAAARQQLSIPREARVILSVGGLVPNKGHGLLISAAGELVRRGIPVRLYIAGEGPLHAALQSQIDELKLQDAVHLLGSIGNEELRDWYSSADVSCLVSAREGWANVLLESMACGTPVVATRVWGTPEVIASEELGLFVERNTEAIADGLQSALRRPWDRRRIAEFGRQRSWGVVAEEVEHWISSQAGDAGIKK